MRNFWPLLAWFRARGRGKYRERENNDAEVKYCWAWFFLRLFVDLRVMACERRIINAWNWFEVYEEKGSFGVNLMEKVLGIFERKRFIKVEKNFGSFLVDWGDLFGFYLKRQNIALFLY